MRRIGTWLGESGGGLYILTGDAKAADRVASVTGGPGIDITGLTVADCVRALAAELGLPPVGRMAELTAALAERDGGDVTVVLHNLDAASDPDGIAGTIARRLAAEPGVRVVVSMRSRDDGLLALLGPATLDDRALWTERWSVRKRPERLSRLSGHRAYVRALTTVKLPGGRPLIASGCEDGDIRLWDPIAGEQFGAPIAAHEGGVRALAALPTENGDLLVSGDSDGRVRLWVPHLGRIDGELNNGTAARALAVVPGDDGHLLAVAGGTKVRLWNPATNSIVREMALTEGEILSLAVHIHGDRTLLTAGAHAGTTSTWDLATGEVLARFPEQGGTVASIGSMLVTARAGRARFWDPATGEHLRDTSGHHRAWRKTVGAIEAMTAVTLQNGRTRLATAGEDETIHLWDAETGAGEGGVIIDGKGRLRTLSPLTLPDGRVLLATASGQDVFLWDTAEAAPTGHRRVLGSIAADTEVLTSTDLYEVHRWDVRTGEALGVFVPKDVDTVQHVFVHAGGRTLATDHRHGTRVWDPATGELVAEIPAPYVRHLRLPDGSDRLATAASFLNPAVDDDPAVRLWDPITGAETTSIRRPDTRIRAVVYVARPDGSHWIGCRTDDSALVFFDAATLEPVGARLTGLAGHRVPGALSNGSVMSAEDDGTIHFWDPSTGETVGVPLPGLGKTVRAVAEIPTPHGMWLGVGDDEVLSLWADGVRVDEIGFGAAIRELTALPDGGLAVGTKLGLTVLDLHTDRPTYPLPEPVVAAAEPVAEPERVVDRATGQARIAWRAGDIALKHLTATVDGRVLAVDGDGTVHVGTADGELTPLRLDETGDVQAMTALQVDGRTAVAIYGADGTVDEDEYPGVGIRLWDIDTAEPLGEQIEHEMLTEYSIDIGSFTQATDGGTLVGTTGNEFAVSVSAFCLTERTMRHNFSIESVSDVYAQAAAPFDLNGRACVVATMSDYDQDDDSLLLVCAWDLETGDAVGRPWHFTCDEHNTSSIAAVVLNGRPTLAATVPGDKIRLRRILDGAPVATFDTTDAGAASRFATGTVGGAPVLAASHDGGAVTVWDLATRRRIATADASAVGGMVFAADGLLVLSGPEGLTAMEVRG